MKLWAIVRYEVGYQLRRPWPWLFFAVLLVVDFLMTRDNSLSEALYEDFFVNSPFAAAKTTVFGCLIWLLMAPPIAGEAAARDVATEMHPLVYTTPLCRAEYLGGRFLGALLLNALLLLAVPLGIALGVHAPGVDPQALGPFRISTYLTTYAYLALPNAFIGTALQFALAVRTGRPMASYLGSLLLLFSGFFVASLLLFKRGAGPLLDPVGIRFVVEDFSHLWTTAEKSWRPVRLEGTVLANRLLWSGVAVAALLATGARFRFAHRAAGGGWLRARLRRPAPEVAEARATAVATRVVATARETRAPRTFGVRTHARQAIAVAGDSFRALAGSWAGIAMLVALPLLTVLVVLDQTMSNGVPLVPTTPLVLAELTAPVSAELSRWVIVPLLLIFFAGELVWREREAGLGEIGDALPGSDWAPLLGKLLALALLLAAFLAMQAAAGMAAQALRAHHDLQIGLYVAVLFGLQLPEYLLFAVLALAVHVAVDQKYVGHLVAVVAYVVLALASLFGIEHDLLVYGAGPGWSYSEMRGFGPSLAPWAWFRAYWAAWAILLAVAARLLWVRGHAGGMRARLREARRRMTGGTARTAAGAAVLALSLGGFIFHNTNVRHTYLSGAERTERSAEYERRYRRFAGAPQPRLAAARLRVEIHPRRGAVEVRGRYRLVNRGDAPIDSVHVAVSPGVETGPVAFDRPATLALADEALGHRIYALARPLAPGDSLAMDFHVRAARDGFAEDGADASVAENGTYFTNGWLPAIGYQGARELVSAADRRAHGLAPRPLIPFLEDEEARKERGGGIDFEAVVGTDAGQTPVAPGALRGTWTEGGRRYFRYASDAPIGSEWSFFSAVYGVREVRWTDPATGRTVAVRILHHPGHTAHLDRMARAVVSSLGTYARHFGPYPYGHLTVVERPGTGTGMHADAAMVSHGEGFTWWNPSDGPRGLDFPSAVVAHEVAHQWTVPYAAVEGAPVMSEGIAWYHAILAVEEARGKDHARRLLHYLRQPHPIRQIRRGEPLLRGLDPYLSRRRAPFALYALREYAGGDRVNGALRRLVETHRRPGAPRATTLDLYRELQAATPDSLRPLLHELFEINAFWEMETEAVRADSLPGGAWRVTLEVRARKTAYDAEGTEREMPLDEWLPVGVFGAAGAETGALGAPLYLRMHRVRAGRQMITVTVPRRPVRAGLDPHHLLDWGEDTNVAEVRIGR